LERSNSVVGPIMRDGPQDHCAAEEAGGSIICTLIHPNVRYFRNRFRADDIHGLDPDEH